MNFSNLLPNLDGPISTTWE